MNERTYERKGENYIPICINVKGIITKMYTIGIKLSIFWYKFSSHTQSQANLFYFFRTKEYFDPSILCIYSKN